MSDWRENMAAALIAGGVDSQTEWVAKFPGVHCWFDFHDMPSCAVCGKVQLRDASKQKPCRGITTIGLRGVP